jgi:hypothetical protein
LIWRPRKNCNSPIMLISNSLLMSCAIIRRQRVGQATKDYIINIHLNN